MKAESSKRSGQRPNQPTAATPTIFSAGIMAKRQIIMAVDDEESNLRVIETLLTPLGYEIVQTRDGPEALETAIKVSPDLILLDAVMPEMNGFKTARRLKSNKETEDIPIVMVSSLKDTEDRIKAMDAGVDDFLNKPFDAPELLVRVRSTLKVKAYNDHVRNCRKELEQEVAERTKQLRIALKGIPQAALETIYRLTRASEYRDEDTGAHIQRMSHYTAAVAKNLGFDETSIERILYASPMHDVGKIGIPDEILLKAGKLTDQEWEIMKRHTVIGSRILEGSQADFIKLAEEIALTHHEKWDGTGYPNGLKGEGIPVEGNITAIADVFDALTSKRPYKEPYSVEKSFDIISDSRGTHFDPRIVDAFFDVKEEILDIKEKYKDNGESMLYKKSGVFKKPEEILKNS